MSKIGLFFWDIHLPTVFIDAILTRLFDCRCIIRVCAIQDSPVLNTLINSKSTPLTDLRNHFLISVKDYSAGWIRLYILLVTFACCEPLNHAGSLLENVWDCRNNLRLWHRYLLSTTWSHKVYQSIRQIEVKNITFLFLNMLLVFWIDKQKKTNAKLNIQTNTKLAIGQ